MQSKSNNLLAMMIDGLFSSGYEGKAVTYGVLIERSPDK